MTAIPVAATRGEPDYVGKATTYPGFGPQDSELTHTRVVDDQGTALEDDQFPADGRMPSLARSADALCLEHFTADQLVDDRALAHPR